MADAVRTNRRGGWRGVLWLVGIVLTVAGFWGLLELRKAAMRASAEQRERKEVARRAEFVEMVRRGDDGSRIFIHEPGVVVELANDPTCVVNFRHAYFFMADLDDARYAEVRRLTNLRDLTFYSCGRVDVILMAMQGMPSIESVYFEPFQLAEKDLPLLGTFPNLKRVHLEHVVDAAYRNSLEHAAPGVEIEIGE